MYLLFKQAGLLQSQEELWEIRKVEVLAKPDPLAGNLSAEQRQAFESTRDEIAKVFKNYIKQDQIVFREMPPGNEHVLRGFTSHYVIDSNIVCRPEVYHKCLADLYGSDSECQQSCQCLRQLLIHSMADALSRQKGGPTKDCILHDVMAQYIRYSRYELNLPTVTPPAVSAAVTPDASRPSSASNTHGPTASPGSATHAVGSRQTPAAPSSRVSSLSLDGINLNAEASTRQNSTPSASSSQPLPTVRIVREHETPVLPSLHDPVVFHNNVVAALSSVMQQSAGQTSQQGVVRSCNHPSPNGLADTVTIQLCPNGSKHPLEPSDIMLRSCTVEGNIKRLYLPKGFDIGSWSENRSLSAQQLYHLLERVHELIQPGMAAVNLYYDADDGCIAFNKGNQLWYNAFADDVNNEAPQSLRVFNWYITVCHELAHNFCSEHDEIFSDYLAHVVMQYSRGFYDLCRRYHIDI